MAKFIEVHRLPLSGGDGFPVLQNLDYVASVTAGYAPGTTLIELQRTPDLAGSSTYLVAESYDEIRKLIAKAQGGIPMRKEVE